MNDLRRSLIDAIRPYEGDTALHGSSAGEIADEALAIFASWLRESAAQAQAIADTLTEPTARTIALVRVDTIHRLVDLSPTSDTQTDTGGGEA